MINIIQRYKKLSHTKQQEQQQNSFPWRNKKSIHWRPLFPRNKKHRFSKRTKVGTPTPLPHLSNVFQTYLNVPHNQNITFSHFLPQDISAIMTTSHSRSMKHSAVRFDEDESPTKSFDFLIEIGFDKAMSQNAAGFVRLPMINGEVAHIEGPIEIKFFRYWPGSSSETITFPSILAYKNHDSNRVLFGYEAFNKRHDLNYMIVAGFKAALHDTDETLSMNARLEEKADILGKEITDFVTDEIKLFKNYTERYLQNRFGARDMKRTRIKVKIGVPACFTDLEIQDYGQCCLNAGYREEDITFGNETEALLIDCVQQGKLEGLEVRNINSAPYFILMLFTQTERKSQAISGWRWSDLCKLITSISAGLCYSYN